MIQEIVLYLSPQEASNDQSIRSHIAMEIGCRTNEIAGYTILKKSIDARRRNVKIRLKLKAFIGEEAITAESFLPHVQNVQHKEPVLIAGAGPAGLFAALKLIEKGYKPLILERGKDVRSRRRDLAQLNRTGIVHPDSNYCFGEGGAGTYSDGKLYTRSHKRGDIQEILQWFIYFGASENIAYEAHPHIGTNKLPKIISAMSDCIRACGGEVHFETKITDLLISNSAITGVKTTQGKIEGKHLILATGHSARDIFELLEQKGISIEPKPFALGVRIEHPQSLIDTIQYSCQVRDPYLPPASYSIVSQQLGKGVFSFCMCPGGIIAPASTAPGELVVNGWSPSRRNNPYANSGTVVTVDEKDFQAEGCTGVLAAMRYQQIVERRAFEAGGGNLVAPAQRLTDFVAGKISQSLPDCSYVPGLRPAYLHEVLPKPVHDALQKAIVDFGKKMKGYYTHEAVMVATESRTSTPVRIPRDKFTLQHPQIKGLYPCGEGAGYAGGIVSAAMDGQRCAIAIAQNASHIP